jgi:hypothetical protein
MTQSIIGAATKFAAYTTEVKTAQTMKKPKPNSREKAAPKEASPEGGGH